MTLPASFPLSMSQIATELGLSLPLSLGHAWVLQLGGVGGLPLSFSSLLGKTGRFDGSLSCSSGGGGQTISFGSAPFFGGQLNGATANGTSGTTNLGFLSAPNWSGNIKLINNTTGISLVLGKSNSTTWTAGFVSNLLRGGQTDSFTLIPSS
jgi:hypothetical protein